MTTQALREVQCVTSALIIARASMSWAEYLWRLETELEDYSHAIAF